MILQPLPPLTYPTITPIDCEYCGTLKLVTPKGDCPDCGRLLTGFPGFHMRPAPGREISDLDRQELERFDRYLKLLGDIKDPSPQDRIRVYDIIYSAPATLSD